MHQENATVWTHDALSKDVLMLEVAAPKIAAEARPGQFVHVKPLYNSEPILRRPLSIHKIDHEQGRIFLLYQIKGKGTEALARLREGDALDVLGPLGNGFDLDERKAPFLLVGGGMGIAPFTFVAQKLASLNIPFKAVLGSRTEKELYTSKDFVDLGCQPILATDDGSIGYHGNALDAATKVLEKEQFGSILACGPHGMLKGLKAFAESYALPVQLSLEARMACGVGACLGCTVKKSVGSGYYKVCKDGPVFAAEEVNLDA